MYLDYNYRRDYHRGGYYNGDCCRNRGFNDILLFEVLSRRHCSPTPAYVPYPVVVPYPVATPYFGGYGYPYRIM